MEVLNGAPVVTSRGVQHSSDEQEVRSKPVHLFVLSGTRIDPQFERFAEVFGPFRNRGSSLLELAQQPIEFGLIESRIIDGAHQDTPKV